MALKCDVAFHTRDRILGYLFPVCAILKLSATAFCMLLLITQGCQMLLSVGFHPQTEAFFHLRVHCVLQTSRKDELLVRRKLIGQQARRGIHPSWFQGLNLILTPDYGNSSPPQVQQSPARPSKMHIHDERTDRSCTLA